jgi:3-oxoacyl-[acyl-carrier-protein] synthase III
VVDVIETYGNVSASTVPIALDELLKGLHGPLPEAANIVLTAVGGGYTSGGAVIEWSGGTPA